MPPAKNSNKSKGRVDLIQVIKTPLGFYVLSLLIVESTLAIVLSTSKLNEEHVWTGFLWMIGIFVGVILIVSVLAVCCPKNLLYGKDEHANPALSASALNDAIEDAIAKNIKSECLNSPKN
jgi:hypothetical protein